MSAASHKYMSQEISDAERAATFAARHDTLDFILGRLRADAGKLSFNSFHIVGARGAGKTTLLHMVRQRVNSVARRGESVPVTSKPIREAINKSMGQTLATILRILSDAISVT